MSLDGINHLKNQINISKFKGGLERKEIAGDAKMESVFDAIDENKDGILTQDEINKAFDSDNDGNVSKNETKQFIKDNNLKENKVKKKDIQDFLNKLGLATENVEEVTENENGTVTISYNDGSSKTIKEDKSYITTKDNTVTEYDNKDTKLKETTTTEDGVVTTTYAEDGTTPTEKKEETSQYTKTTTYNEEGQLDQSVQIDKESGAKETITYDDNLPAEKKVEQGTNETVYKYVEGQEQLSSKTENKGHPVLEKKTTYSYNEDGSYAETQPVQNGKITTTVDKEGNVTSKVKTETVNGQEVSLELDKEGNIPGVIVQNGESPAAIAKKFGCSVDELIKLNADQLKGKDNKRYFEVGAEIKLPNSVGIEKFNEVQEGRKPAEIAKAEYAHDAEIRRQKAEAQKKQQAEEKAYYQKLGVKNFNNKGQKVKADGWGNKEFEVIGDVGYGRQLVKHDGKLYTRSHDGKILREDYLQAHKAFVSKPQNQRNNTASGMEDVTYVKDNNGKVWYFDEKTGKAIVKGDYQKVVKQESAFVANQLHTAAKGIGTDNELLEKGVKNIYSPEILAGVNAELRTKDKDYNVDVNKTQMMPVEALILDENNHKSARPLLKTLVNSGAMSTQEQARTIKREMEYELAGDGNSFGIDKKRVLEHFEFGTSYTSTEDLNEIMQMTSSRDVRLEIENQYKNDPKFAGLEPDDSSYVRARIGQDGGIMHWDAQEVDQFDANWIKTGAYQEAQIIGYDEKGNPIIDEGDQAHRNNVIGRLVFDYQDKEALNKGLDAINENPNSFDYQYLDHRAEKKLQQIQMVNINHVSQIKIMFSVIWQDFILTKWEMLMQVMYQQVIPVYSKV